MLFLVLVPGGQSAHGDNCPGIRVAQEALIPITGTDDHREVVPCALGRSEQQPI